MSLSRQDLIEHEQKLTAIIEHAESERNAIRILIEGFNLRDHDSGISSSNGSKLTIPAAVGKVIAGFNNKPFFANDVTREIIVMGVRKKVDWSNLRPTVSTVLREMCAKGELKRRNVGSENKKKFEYRIKTTGKLL